MENKNFYATIPQQNNYYPYGYAAGTTFTRPEPTSYMIPQAMPAAYLKGRPVSSFEEAKVSQIDLDGSTFIFPDTGNKKIYTKRINMDGTAIIQTYTLEEKTADAAPIVSYVTKDEFLQLKKTIDSFIEELTGSQPNTK